MRWYIYGVLLIIVYNVAFQLAQELPRFGQRLGVVILSGFFLMYGALFIAKGFRERN